jgi:hypothetical protein
MPSHQHFYSPGGDSNPYLRVTRPSRMVRVRLIVSRHVPQKSSDTMGFGRLLETGWDGVANGETLLLARQALLQSRLSARRDGQTGVDVPAVSVPTPSRQAYLVGIWARLLPQMDRLVVLARRSGRFSTGFDSALGPGATGYAPFGLLGCLSQIFWDTQLDQPLACRRSDCPFWPDRVGWPAAHPVRKFPRGPHPPQPAPYDYRRGPP